MENIIIVGTGIAGLFCALNFPGDKNILMITKDEAHKSDSYLAQGGICVLKNPEDFNSFLEDTMKAGHYENNKRSVEVMIDTSREVINDLLSFGVKFQQENGEFVYTKEGAHSTSRILYHDDVTGREMTSKLLSEVKRRKNIKIMEHTTMVDILVENNTCKGIVVNKDDNFSCLQADYIVFATGGIGGLFNSSTNYRHITGDSLGIALKHNIKIKNINYIQIHPTTFYSKNSERRFLISESVRGEGAVLLNKNMERFVDELLPRDVVSNEIKKQMAIDKREYVWLSLTHMGSEKIKKRFPNIYKHCLDQGYDITKECIPVTPAQHYHMGGIGVDIYSKTSMEHLYAIGESSNNGVHGANRLASNSLLESLVFAKRAAIHIINNYESLDGGTSCIDLNKYNDLDKIMATYKKSILDEIERVKEYERSYNDEIKCG